MAYESPRKPFGHIEVTPDELVGIAWDNPGQMIDFPPIDAEGWATLTTRRGGQFCAWLKAVRA